MNHRRYGAWFYLGFVLSWVVAIIAFATLAGAILFPVIGKLFGSSREIGELALIGARNLAEWTAKVWALSIAIVLAFHHAYRHRAERREPTSEQERRPPVVKGSREREARDTH